MALSLQMINKNTSYSEGFLKQEGEQMYRRRWIEILGILIFLIIFFWQVVYAKPTSELVISTENQSVMELYPLYPLDLYPILFLPLIVK